MNEDKTALIEEAREHLRLDARVPTANLILRLVNALESGTAEVERLRAQRDEAIARIDGFFDSPVIENCDPFTELWDVRTVLSRTEGRRRTR